MLLEKGHTEPTWHYGAHLTHSQPILLLSPPYALHTAHPELGSAKTKFSQDSKPLPRLLALPGALSPNVVV